MSRYAENYGAIDSSDESLQSFIDSTLNYDNNRNNGNTQNNGESEKQKNIFGHHTIKTEFVKVFINYHINKSKFKHTEFTDDCCICRDNCNYLIKLCNCNELKYCYTCFIDTIKSYINTTPTNLFNFTQYCKVDKANAIKDQILDYKCTVCKLNNNVSQIYNDISVNKNASIVNILTGLDFFRHQRWSIETISSNEALDTHFTGYILYFNDTQINIRLTSNNTGDSFILDKIDCITPSAFNDILYHIKKILKHTKFNKEYNRHKIITDITKLSPYIRCISI